MTIKSGILKADVDKNDSADDVQAFSDTNAGGENDDAA